MLACDIVSCVACNQVSKPETVRIPDAIPRQLPQFVNAQRLISTHLSEGGETVVLYNTAADELDPLPMIAIVVDSKVVRTFEARSDGGFTRLLADCEFPATTKSSAFALAYRAGGDGAATTFFILGYRDGKYGVWNTITARASRMIFNGIIGQFQLWAGEGSRECVWCPQRYRTSSYRFTGTRFEKVSSTRIAGLRDPGEIADTPLVSPSRTP